jgi:hypothetical protein
MKIGKYTVHYEGFSCREGECPGRGDGGSPIIRECLLPRSEVETTRFRPFDDAACCALENFATGVSGDSGTLCEYPQDWKTMSRQSLHLQSFLSRSLREWKNRRPLIVCPPRGLFREMNIELWEYNRKRTN